MWMGKAALDFGSSLSSKASSLTFVDVLSSFCGRFGALFIWLPVLHIIVDVSTAVGYHSRAFPCNPLSLSLSVLTKYVYI